MRKVFCLATVSAVLLVAGCAGAQPTPVGAPSPESSGPSATASPSPTAAVSPVTSPSSRPSDTARSPTKSTKVPATLQFTATKVDGGAFDGANLAGQPALFWFWAPWCPVCRGQIEQVQSIARRYEGKVNVIGVGSLDDVKAISGFAADAPGITHLSDESGAVWRHFEVVQQSSFVLLDDKGAKVYTVGYGGSDDLADRVAAVAG
jgi:thiol-disulfide isomerase/thioredoxin